MARMTMRRGRYIPLGAHASDGERLAALESFIVAFSEETECAMHELEGAVAAQERMLNTWQDTLGDASREVIA